MAEDNGNGRSRALAAAMDLLAQAELTDVTTFIGMKQVARAVPVSPGTMTYYFGSREVLVREVLQHVLERFGTEWSYDGVDRAMADLARGEGDLAGVARSLAQQVARLAPGPDSPEADDGQRRLFASFGVAEALLAAVAPNDPVAAQTVAALAAHQRERYAALTQTLMDITGRAWRPGADPDQLVIATQALVEGFLRVRRFDPGSAPVAVFADTLLRLYLSLTANADDLDADAVDALHARFSKEPLGVDQKESLARATAAVQRIYARHGWNGLTIPAVAAELGVDRIAMVRIFTDRRGLAAAVWAHRLPALRRVARSLGGTAPVEEVVQIFLEELVELARRDVPLTAALLEGVFSATLERATETSTETEEASQTEAVPAPESLNPKELVPLPAILAPLLEERAEQLALDAIPGGLSAFDAAALLCNATLQLSFTRPQWNESGWSRSSWRRPSAGCGGGRQEVVGAGRPRWPSPQRATAAVLWRAAQEANSTDSWVKSGENSTTMSEASATEKATL
ncbi:regulatory protein, tetR family [Raineyella antarctica]|uniref:Regulatory protein, tetR family n=1 Tax=Raineyella antarctica TaxID=1577474 RepID=A0A1G6GEW6_9ACTN|nr:TetR family transcriptional regulator [Raineyella antarctica]SDB80285.1 regulatory protein, tetR family [Raineyella antarctica]